MGIKAGNISFSSEPAMSNENLIHEPSVNSTVQDESILDLVDPITLPLIRYYIDKSYSKDENKTTSEIHRQKLTNRVIDTTLHVEPEVSDTKPESLFSAPKLLTTQEPAFHYITKAPKSTDEILNSEKLDSREMAPEYIASFKVIAPTTYSPPKFFLKSLLPKSVSSHTVPVFSFRSTNMSNIRHTTTSENPTTSLSKAFKTLKAVRKLINPITVNHALSSLSDKRFNSDEKLASDVDAGKPITHNRGSYRHSTRVKPIYVPAEVPSEVTSSSTAIRFTITHSPTTSTTDSITTTEETATTESTTTTTTTTTTTPIETTSTTSTPTIKTRPIVDDYISEKFHSRFETEKYYIGPTNQKKFRTTVEIPSAVELLDSEFKEKQLPDEPPAYKPKPFPKLSPTTAKPDTSQNNSAPARVSRVNAAIKSMIVIGATRKSNSKCGENQSLKCYNDLKQRYLFRL